MAISRRRLSPIIASILTQTAYDALTPERSTGTEYMVIPIRLSIQALANVYPVETFRVPK